ncbi:MAG: phosphoribosylpyrophosphate synthetase [Chitinophagaceae bacterium]|nr:phosphoribosylpyrophosphate synthetase [Chitinophagaceae bacterium]
MQTFDTVSQALTELKKQGYSEDFNLMEEFLECRNGQYQITPEYFAVDSFYRFEGESDPGDESIVYAISAPKFGLKGVLVSAFGVYSETATNEIMEKLRINR